MKKCKILLALLLAAVLCVTAMAMPAAAQEVEPYRASYLGVGSYTINQSGYTVGGEASMLLYSGDYCRITATLQKLSGSSWVKASTIVRDTGKQSVSSLRWADSWVNCNPNLTYRIRYDFYAYVGNTVVESAVRYSSSI